MISLIRYGLTTCFPIAMYHHKFFASFPGLRSRSYWCASDRNYSAFTWCALLFNTILILGMDLQLVYQLLCRVLILVCCHMRVYICCYCRLSSVHGDYDLGYLSILTSFECLIFFAECLWGNAVLPYSAGLIPFINCFFILHDLTDSHSLNPPF